MKILSHERKQKHKCLVSQSERDCVLCRNGIKNNPKRWPRQGIFRSEFRGAKSMASADKSWMSEDARRILRLPNAGGHSILSEALSVQYFVQSFGAYNVCAEMEIGYWFTFKMADFLVTVDTFERGSFDHATNKSIYKGEKRPERIGVSVTRAMGFPNPSRFTVDDAIALLRKKLYGLIVARNAVCEEDSFKTSYLHVLCQTERIAKLVERAFYLLADEDDPKNEFALTTSIIVGCTVVDDPAIYASSKVLSDIQSKGK